MHQFEQGSDEENGVVNRPLKAYLYWVTREYGSLAWFKDAMKGVSSSNHKQVILIVCIYRVNFDLFTIFCMINEYVNAFRK